jgi:hypothetical protein
MTNPIVYSTSSRDPRVTVHQPLPRRTANAMAAMANAGRPTSDSANRPMGNDFPCCER